MTRKKIYIITDSRGRGLETFLRSRFASDTIIIKVDVLPGATLERATAHLEKNFDESCDLVILSAGICNLTERSEDSGKKLLTYTSDQAKVTAVKDILTITAGKYKGSLLITTIPPASLNKYYSYNNKETPPSYLNDQQKNLLQDLESINQVITTLNKADNKQVIDLHTKCFSATLDSRKKGKPARERRKVRLLEKLLEDGVHPDVTLRLRWFDRYHNAINSWLVTQSSSDTDADAGDGWDYKRQGSPQPSTSAQ